jgi:hypothetical protein
MCGHRVSHCVEGHDIPLDARAVPQWTWFPLALPHIRSVRGPFLDGNEPARSSARARGLLGMVEVNAGGARLQLSC